MLPANLGLPSQSPPARILSGWKDIATYLGKGVRTVQRYERELRLPVRRPAGKRRGSVLATRDELDLWVTASPSREVQLHNPVSPIYALKQSISQMHQLRMQTQKLRASLIKCRSNFQSNLSVLAQQLSRGVQASGASPKKMN
jgi:hypothetical protein